MVRQTNNRLGETRLTNKGKSCTIIEYINATDITIRFDDSGYTRKTNYSNFKAGKIDDKMSTSVCGIGHLGDATISKEGVIKDSYKLWYSILVRLKNKSSYKNVLISDDWKNYSNFEKWYDIKYPRHLETKHRPLQIDKDILCMCENVGKIYSENTCVFIYNDLNMVIQGVETFLNNRYSGIRSYGKMYEAVVSVKNKNTRLGVFETREEAVCCRKKYMISRIALYISEMKELGYDEIIIDSLRKISKMIEDV